MTTTMELNELELERVAGGKTNPNMEPGKLPNIDKIINNKFYEWIATKIANWLQPPKPRDRKVNNDVDIYDVDI